VNSFLTKMVGVVSNCAYPLLWLKTLSDRDWRENFSERKGFGAWDELPRKDRAKLRIWFHGASVGEINGLGSVFSGVCQQREDCEIVVSTVSLTGRAAAREKGYGILAALLPFDYPRAVSRVIDRVKPDLFVVTETEIWPTLYQQLKSRGVPILIVNGRISDYSYPNYRRFRFLLSAVFGAVTKVLAQTAKDRERFISLGAREGSVLVSGSTKYDHHEGQLSVEQRKSLATSFGLDTERPCFVAGSVRPGEDEVVINAFLAVRSTVPRLQLIIAPRHPDRFDAVASLLEVRRLKFNRRSKLEAVTQADILLLDTIGELRAAYSLSSIAFVGATLVDVGGHNPLEPASYKSPVIVGPYTRNVTDAISELKHVGGVFEVESEERLTQVLRRLCLDEDVRRRAGDGAYKVWKQNQGATEIVLKQILELLPDIAEIEREDDIFNLNLKFGAKG